MPTITLSAGDDLVQRLAYEADPVRAVIELVWNGLDADADHVIVSLQGKEADGVIGVRLNTTAAPQPAASPALPLLPLRGRRSHQGPAHRHGEPSVPEPDDGGA